MTTILVALVISAGLILNYRTRRRAEALLQDVRALQIGESSITDVQRIVERHRGFRYLGGYASSCPDADSFYAVSSNNYITTLGFAQPLLQTLGVPQWNALAMFLLKNGHLLLSDVLRGI